MTEWPGGAIVLTACCALFVGLLHDGFRKGRLTLHAAISADRDSNPVGFWSIAALMAAIGAASLLAAADIGLRAL